MVLKSIASVAGNVFKSTKSVAANSFVRAMEHNIEQIRSAAADAATATASQPVKVLDLGCWDGVNTLRLAPAGAQLYGTEISVEAGLLAKEKGIEVVQADLNEPLPWEDKFFDIVISNQVIEHLADTDNFVAEAYRVLKPGGTVVASTENMSSWHNIGALLLGWQAFSLTNISDKKSGIGNPLSLSRDWESYEDGWQHIRIFSYNGLRELFAVHGFKDTKVLGAGYYPLPSRVADFDARHAAFITVVGTRPE